MILMVFLALISFWQSQHISNAHKMNQQLKSFFFPNKKQ